MKRNMSLSCWFTRAVLKGITPPINSKGSLWEPTIDTCAALNSLSGHRLLRVADPHTYNVLCAALLSRLVSDQSDAWHLCTFTFSYCTAPFDTWIKPQCNFSLLVRHDWNKMRNLVTLPRTSPPAFTRKIICWCVYCDRTVVFALAWGASGSLMKVWHFAVHIFWNHWSACNVLWQVAQRVCTKRINRPFYGKMSVLLAADQDINSY